MSGGSQPQHSRIFMCLEDYLQTWRACITGLGAICALVNAHTRMQTNIPAADCDRGLRCRMPIHENNSLPKKIPHVQSSVLLELIAKLLAVKKETRSYNFPKCQSSRMGSNSANKMYQPRTQYKRQDMKSKLLKWTKILPVRMLRCRPFISSTQLLAKVHLAFLLPSPSSP